MMRNKTLVFCIIFLVVVIFISGCQENAEILPTPTEPPLPTATSAPIYQTNDGITLGANSNCPDRAAFGHISENIPSSGVMVSSPIHFRWYYSAAEGPAPDWSSVCVPTSFTLYLSPGPYYSTTVSYSITPTSADNLVNLLMYSFYLSDALQPGTSYRWMVVGQADGIEIDTDQLPLLQDNSDPNPLGSHFQTAQTGTDCDAQTISPVNLLGPYDGSTLKTDTPLFQWDMPNCNSQAYWLKFDTDPQMASPDIGWVTSQESFLMFSGSLQPCVIYYWQVQAGLYSLAYHQSIGDWATTSEIRSFIIRSPNCPNVDAVPTATPTSIPTATLIPTNTPTQTPKPTRTPEPTATPVICSNQPDPESCKAHGDVCYWYKPPTGGEGYCTDIP